MPTRSGVLGAATINTIAEFHFATVPSTETWIVKTVVVNNGGAGVSNVYVAGRSPDSSVEVPIYFKNVAVGAVDTISAWIVLPPGWLLFASLSVAGVMVYVAGAELQGHL